MLYVCVAAENNAKEAESKARWDTVQVSQGCLIIVIVLVIIIILWFLCCHRCQRWLMCYDELLWSVSCCNMPYDHLLILLYSSLQRSAKFGDGLMDVHVTIVVVQEPGEEIWFYNGQRTQSMLYHWTLSVSAIFRSPCPVPVVNWIKLLKMHDM